MNSTDALPSAPLSQNIISTTASSATLPTSFDFVSLYEGSSHILSGMGRRPRLVGASSVPFCLTMSSLIPRRCHRPSVRIGLRSVARHDGDDFVHEIRTRPPQYALYEVVRLRRTLSSYQCVHLCYNLVFCVAPFQVTLSSRLACHRFPLHTDPSLRGFRVLPRLGLGESTFPRTQID